MAVVPGPATTEDDELEDDELDEEEDDDDELAVTVVVVAPADPPPPHAARPAQARLISPLTAIRPRVESLVMVSSVCCLCGLWCVVVVRPPAAVNIA